MSTAQAVQLKTQCHPLHFRLMHCRSTQPSATHHLSQPHSYHDQTFPFTMVVHTPPLTLVLTCRTTPTVLSLRPRTMDSIVRPKHGHSCTKPWNRRFHTDGLNEGLVASAHNLLKLIFLLSLSPAPHFMPVSTPIHDGGCHTLGTSGQPTGVPIPSSTVTGNQIFSSSGTSALDVIFTMERVCRC